jgi:predicted dehydrogenase
MPKAYAFFESRTRYATLLRHNKTEAKGMAPFRFAILGAGKIAGKFVEAARMAGCEVVAVASKSGQRAQDFAKANSVAHAYGNYEAMLDAEAIDCAYIATVPSSHYELCMLCLDRRVPVLCEKAMFRNSREAQSAFARAKEQGAFAMEALWSKFLPANRTAKMWLDEGAIGKPVLADASIGFVAPKDPLNRYFNPDLGGGAALDITVYAYEIAAYMLGMEPTLESVHVVRGVTGTDDTETAVLRAGNCLLTLRTSFVASLGEGLTLYGESGRIVVPHPHHATEAMLFSASGDMTQHFRDEVTKNGFVYEIEETARCIRAGLTESCVQPHSATTACARLFDQIEKA